jgi:hypothetical protein
VSLRDFAEEFGAGETAVAGEPDEGGYLLIMRNTESVEGRWVGLSDSRPDATRGGLRASQTAYQAIDQH